MKPTIRFLSLILIVTILAACTPAPTAAPTATASATPTVEPSATPIPPTATPTLEPTPSATPTEATPVFEVDFESPESLDDVAGEVRVENLQDDLKILNQQILAAAEKQGIDVRTLPLIEATRRAASTGGRGGLPTQESVVLKVVSQPNQDRPWVLTSLVNEDGESIGVVVSLLVVKDTTWGTEASEMAVINIVFDKELLSKIDATGMTISREDSDLTKLADVLLREAGAPQNKINSLIFEVLNGPVKEGNTMLDNYEVEGRVEIPPFEPDWGETLDILRQATDGGFLLATNVALGK